MNEVFKLKENWTVNYQNKRLPAKVPGDVTLDLYNNGIIIGGNSFNNVLIKFAFN